MKANILGIGIETAPKEEVLRKFEGMLAGRDHHQIVTVNPEFLMEAQHHAAFRDVLRNADCAVADGIGIRFAAQALKQPVPPRITGIELLEDLCRIAAQQGWRVFLLGAGKGIAHGAANTLLERFPTLAIVGIEQGERHWWRLSDFDLRGKINRSHANILFVAYGAPKQDVWIARNLPHLHSVRIAMGVGGTFDFLAGKVRRAPALFRNLGFEWLWRLVMQPWRFQRILTATWRFWRAVQREKRILGRKEKNLRKEKEVS